MHRATRSPDGGEAAEATDKGVSEDKKEKEPEVSMCENICYRSMYRTSVYLVASVIVSGILAVNPGISP